MIERKFVAANMKEYLIEEFISQSIRGAEHSKTKIQRTPLGEKIVIFSSRPGIIVGRKGQSIKQLTKVLKKRFSLENPQIEIAEVPNPALDANIMAERICSYLERFGISKFKGIAHRIMTEVMGAGAMGIEINMGGKIPSSRAKSWRFYQGYLKKCGDIALTGVHIAHKQALLKSGIVGVKVSIMPPETILPDKITFIEESAPATAEQKVEEKKPAEELKEEKPKRKAAPRKRSPKKKAEGEGKAGKGETEGEKKEEVKSETDKPAAPNKKENKEAKGKEEEKEKEPASALEAA
ncbi:30S ribosomal protein S3 [Candidatus Woesearchaeota archaeon]|nr:30S ribosomal protein S3 [Candidatus Woesearchaeota archaeon]